jgi:hypothetical protein
MCSEFSTSENKEETSNCSKRYEFPYLNQKISFKNVQNELLDPTGDELSRNVSKVNH